MKRLGSEIRMMSAPATAAALAAAGEAAADQQQQEQQQQQVARIRAVDIDAANFAPFGQVRQ